jgi:hypothetical protein
VASRRIALSVLLALAVGMGLCLAGCGGGGSSSTTTASAAGTVPEKEAAPHPKPVRAAARRRKARAERQYERQLERERRESLARQARARKRAQEALRRAAARRKAAAARRRKAEFAALPPGCHDRYPQSIHANGGSLPVACGNFGNAWPLTVERGYLRCEESAVDGLLEQAVVFTAPDGTEYGVNGTAQDEGYPQIDPIWKNSGESFAPKVDIGPLIDKGLSLC